MNTLNDYLLLGEAQFLDAELYFGHGTDNAWDEAVTLACHVLGESPDADRSILSREVTEAEGAQILALYERRIDERIPAPYLTGWAWFCGLKFKVDHRVIIPRSPLGELVSSGFENWLSGPPARILDLCCGSGCIGIAAALQFPAANVVLSDISSEALEVAASNIELHGLQARVNTVQSDAFGAIEGRFDLVLCNPPYVDAEDLDDMPAEYYYEPELALASGEDGLDFSRRLLTICGEYLTEDGWLFLEVGNSCLALERAYPGIESREVVLAHGGIGVYAIARHHLPGLASNARS